MKKLILLTISLLLISFQAIAEDYSDKPIIDEEFKKVELEIQKNFTDCDKIKAKTRMKSWAKQAECREAVYESFTKKGLRRGTIEYFRKNYTSLDFDALHALWVKLKNQKKIARMSPSKRLPGEVVYMDFEMERMWVENRLAEMDNKRMQEEDQRLFKNQ